MAWNQGVDLFVRRHRFLAGCEYVAKYNLGCDPPFTTYHWGNGDSCNMQTRTVVSAGGRGDAHQFGGWYTSVTSNARA